MAISTVYAFKSSRRSLAPGFGDLKNQPGLAPRPARKGDKPQFPGSNLAAVL